METRHKRQITWQHESHAPAFADHAAQDEMRVRQTISVLTLSLASVLIPPTIILALVRGQATLYCTRGLAGYLLKAITEPYHLVARPRLS